MTGSKLRLFAWTVPLSLAAGFTVVLWRPAAALSSRPPEAVVPLPTTLPDASSSSAPTRTAPIAENVAFERLQRELATLRQRVAQRERQVQLQNAALAAPKSRKSLTEAPIPAEEWRDAGTTSPQALVETALWAGAGGDVARMTELLEFTPAAQAAAEELWQRLPPDIRLSHADATALTTLLATGAVPLGSAKLMAEFPQAENDHLLIVQLNPAAEPQPAGPPEVRLVKLTARRQSAGDWRLLVTENTLRSLSERLTSPGGL
ncbi:hypothetical protein [Actomonas aquatica]|uniref:Tim44-like domain-containing protein n=1 Tax=Actomonas aquatica TaxID=2866162 RepID=A0ABZ1C7L8_9BACT|nr:hypothetical protein [Opitutus sp. WL0086]WRQ87322.1 hypothetical protein K1X11_021115 [Opitutus sp. WL0086]